VHFFILFTFFSHSDRAVKPSYLLLLTTLHTSLHTSVHGLARKVIYRFTLAAACLLLTACDATLTSKGQDSQETSHSQSLDSHEKLTSKPLYDEYKKTEKKHLKPIKNKDLWAYIREGYQLNEVVPPIGEQRISGLIKRYRKHPKDILQQTEQASLYLHYVVAELEKNNMPTELALLPFVESRFDPFAYSYGRASGLWQFIPGTATRFNMERNWWHDERRDVIKSTQSAIDYLQYLHRFFDGDWLLAIAAYNAGEGTVRRAIKRNRKAGKPTDYWSLSLPKQTQFYLPKLLTWARIIAAPESYDLTIVSVPDTPIFTTIDVGSQIDLATFSEVSGIPIEQVYALNPAFNRWATDPDAPHELLVPTEMADSTIASLQSYPVENRMQWQRYTVKSGDALSVIAQRFGTHLQGIKKANKLSSSRIKIGQKLIIPKPSKQAAFYNSSADQRLVTRQNTSHKKGRHRVNHITIPGDTLWGIGKAYAVRPDSIAHWNNMSARDILRNKQQLVIWTTKALAERHTSSSTQIATINNDSEKRQVLYTVKNGDNLSFIASRFSVAVMDIRQWNNIETKKYLKPGQVLRLLVTVADRGNF
jgi:membrane-bound lytic murein transglycosylase D